MVGLPLWLVAITGPIFWIAVGALVCKLNAILWMKLVKNHQNPFLRRTKWDDDPKSIATDNITAGIIFWPIVAGLCVVLGITLVGWSTITGVRVLSKMLGCNNLFFSVCKWIAA